MCISRIVPLAMAGMVCFSCTAARRPVEPGPPSKEWKSQWVERAVNDAEMLLRMNRSSEAADLLKSTGGQEGAVEYMEQVLYLLGKSRLAMQEPEKAARCFALLRQYYPRSPHRFPDLLESEERAEAALTENRALLAAAGNHGSREAGEFHDIRNRGGKVGAGYEGPRVTNAFYETDVRQALMDISAQTGVSIVPDARVSGLVTAELLDVPLEDALDMVLSPLGLTFGKMVGYYLVGAPIEDSPSHPFLTETVQITPRYLKAEEIPAILPRSYSPYLRVDKGRNSISLTAPRAILKAFEEDLAIVDVPTPQIMIDAMVLETSSDVERSLGFDWEYRDKKGDEAFRIKLLPAVVDSLLGGDYLKVDSPLNVRAAFRAMAQKGRLKIRANPRVATTEGCKAQIRIGKEVYFSLIQGSVNFPYFTLEKIATGITLGITPYLGASAEITTDITAEVSDVIESGATGLPITNVRSVDTRIRVMNGETIGIGGLRSQVERRVEKRIPYLGEIPLIGALFGHTITEKSDTEIMIVITPYVMIPPGEFDAL